MPATTYVSAHIEEGDSPTAVVRELGLGYVAHINVSGFDVSFFGSLAQLSEMAYALTNAVNEELLREPKVLY